jgi:hypothetical protein
VINDRGESHCHRTRHRGGRALLVLGCPQGRFPRRSTLKVQNLSLQLLLVRVFN